VFKLLAMLMMFLVVALVLLGLRQHRLELTADSVRIYDQIRDRHHTLLDQRVIIARQTNPWALATALKEQGVNTGEALRSRTTQLTPRGGTGITPQVETDLVAPLLTDGHNPGRPRN
jgi:hypothetical protein